jgi:hypothetical protein
MKKIMKKIVLLLNMLFITNITFGMQTHEKPPRPKMPRELTKEIIEYILNQSTIDQSLQAIQKYALIDENLSESNEITEFLIQGMFKKSLNDHSRLHLPESIQNNPIFLTLQIDTEGIKKWIQSKDFVKDWISGNKEDLVLENARLGNLSSLILLFNLGYEPTIQTLTSALGSVAAHERDTHSPDNFSAIAELLLHHGASINEKDDHGDSAFNWAIIRNNTHIMKIFLQNNAQVTDNELDCATFLAKYSLRSSEAEELLLAHAPLTIKLKHYLKDRRAIALGILAGAGAIGLLTFIKK